MEIADSKKELEGWLKAYPCIEKMDIWVFDSTVGDVKENWCEGYIKDYCEDYTFEQMDADHEETGYVSESEKYPMFKMALEYSLDKNGMSVRLPCNGLRYDMSAYTLEYLSVLPYMGAGNRTNDGYNFYPDGSGSLISSDTINANIRGKVYGVDYAYHNIANTYQKAIRYPVYGTVATETIYSYSYSYEDPETKKAFVKSGVVSSTIKNLEEIKSEIAKVNGTLSGDIQENTYQRGFLAIIESGESLAEICAYHADTRSDYYSMQNFFNPKPKDEYDISDSISVTSSSTWTVVSNRKYTGSFTLRYVMLSDANRIADLVAPCTTYETTWLGMAEAYRDYLVEKGTLTRLEDSDVKSDIPLYVEVFGALETQQTIATIPVKVMTPLTTFENVYTMYKNFADAGVKNVNFKMTGFANGGMYSTVPSSLKWEKAVGGKEGFETLIKQSKEIAANDPDANLGLYPDFDFAYIQQNKLFDAVNLKRDAIKTIDNRYTSLRLYSATQQTYVSFHQLALSPAHYFDFYSKLCANYKQYGLASMSVGSLGNTLNSDFDEDEPFNREDNKEYTIKAFQDLASLKDMPLSLMTDGGNVYTWQYVDHMINMDLESSRHIKSMASVPFLGALLHGYVQFAGTPLNEEGDIDYAILKAIENGANLYFILSYQNTNELKEDTFLSQYYGIRYDIWQEDAVAYYKELNDLLKDVQTKLIVNHQFLESERILDLSELEADLAERLQQALDQAEKDQINLETGRVVEIADAWRTVANAKDTVEELYQNLQDACTAIDEAYTSVASYGTSVAQLVKDTLDQVEASGGEFEAFLVTFMIEDLKLQISTIKDRALSVLEMSATLSKYADAIEEGIEELQYAKKVLEKAAADGMLDADLKDKYLERLDTVYAELQNDYLPKAQEMLKAMEEKGYSDKNSDKSVVALAVQALDPLVNAKTEYELGLKERCADVLFVADDIFAEMENKDPEDDTNDDQIEEDVEDVEEEVYNNNRVVAVTYGDRYMVEGNMTATKTAYKTFLLNYNSYSVRVVYEGVTYTIPSGGYVVIEHQ